MNGRRFKFGAVVLLAAMLLAGMERTPIPSTVCSFVRSYQAVQNTHAPMRMWERVLYTFALFHQRSIESKMGRSTV